MAHLLPRLQIQQLGLHWRYRPPRERRMSDPTDTIQPGFIEPFTDAFRSRKGPFPNQSELSPNGIGNAEGRQWRNFAGEFDCARLGSFTYVGATPALNRTVYDLM